MFQNSRYSCQYPLVQTVNKDPKASDVQLDDLPGLGSVNLADLLVHVVTIHHVRAATSEPLTIADLSPGPLPSHTAGGGPSTQSGPTAPPWTGSW